MATLRLPFRLNDLLSRQQREGDSKRAREFAAQASQQTNGPTSELKRVYGAYVENERRRRDAQQQR
jgi:hypothetical protein